jgi:DNA-directed RNA polymerase specialized sigma24 family protein
MAEYDDTAARQQRMKAWLESLPDSERQSFEDAIDATPRRSREDVVAAVGEALKQLPEEQRAAVFLCDFGGLSYVEAAAQLHVTAEVMRRRAEAGRRSLELFLPRELLADVKRLNSSEDHGTQG